MSTQPIPIAAKEEQKRQVKRQSLRSDVLYIAGATLVTVGFGLISIRYGLIAAGSYCLLPPLLELAAGFIRGIKRPVGRT